MTLSPSEASAPVPAPDAAVRALEARLVTAYGDASNHESWVCLADRWQVEYLLRIGPSDERYGEARDPGGEAPPATLAWMAVGADALLLDHREHGRQVELSAILFGGPDAFRASGSASGALECRRQRYVDGEATRDVSSAVPIDVDRDAEAALALAVRVRTRYVDAGNFDFWLCTGHGDAPLRHLFGESGVFAPEPLAKVFGEDESLDTARVYRWTASDGSTLSMTPLDTDADSGRGANTGVGEDGRVDGALTLGAIVFPVDGALAATRGDGVSMQCVLQTLDS